MHSIIIYRKVTWTVNKKTWDWDHPCYYQPYTLPLRKHPKPTWRIKYQHDPKHKQNKKMSISFAQHHNIALFTFPTKLFPEVSQIKAHPLNHNSEQPPRRPWTHQHGPLPFPQQGGCMHTVSGFLVNFRHPQFAWKRSFNPPTRHRSRVCVILSPLFRSAAH